MGPYKDTVIDYNSLEDRGAIFDLDAVANPDPFAYVHPLS
jgi:hypothetical protein